MSDSTPPSAPASATAGGEPAFCGEFEIHLTVDGESPAVASGALAAVAAARAWKYARIVLDRGRVPDQPMVTLTVEGTVGEARAAADAAARELAAAGCPVVRVKIEATPWTRGVPGSDEEGAALGPAYYFEHHVKLLLPADIEAAEVERLTGLVVRHAAHLSRNARRTRGDGQQERFVTQRCRQVGNETAARELNHLLAHLSRPYPILSVEREFVVLDSAGELDEGWIPETREEGATAVRQPGTPVRAGWRKFEYGPWAAEETVPQQKLDEETRAALALPPTLRPVLGGDAVVQRPVFDPAMKHHTRAMRLGEPQFTDAESGAAWYAARSEALDLVLAAVAGSPWADHLVLRGSVLLRAWYGTAAREPGDLDFVVEPDTWQVDEERTERMLVELARAAEALSHRAGHGTVRLDADHAARGEIWTYDRVPGRRLVIPWTAQGVPGGTVQLDFVFHETLPAPAAPTPVPRPAGVPGGPLTVRAATRELSLAWKLLWLVSDAYPEGKDLYDAVLLAEDPSFTLSFDLLRAVFVDVEYGYYDRNPVLLGKLVDAAGNADWFEFAKDHPDIAGPPCFAAGAPTPDRLDRFATALAPAFALDDGSGEPARYQQYARWLAPLVAASRAAYAEGGLPTVLERLSAAHVPADSALVVVREVLGRAAHSVEGVLPLLAAFRSPPDPGHPWRRGGWQEDRLHAGAALLRAG